MNACDHAGGDWTAVLRRRPLRLVEGRAEGDHTSEFEIICCTCGDNPYRDYREVSPNLHGAGDRRWRSSLSRAHAPEYTTSSRRVLT